MKNKIIITTPQQLDKIIFSFKLGIPIPENLQCKRSFYNDKSFKIKRDHAFGFQIRYRGFIINGSYSIMNSNVILLSVREFDNDF